MLNYTFNLSLHLISDGASLFYVSAKINKNCDLLYKYLVHRIYGLPFKTPALVVEKDAVFIPSGWDNEKKIAILYENIQSCMPDDNYNDVIIKPETRQTLQKDIELTAEDDQSFLLKMQAQLTQNVPTAITSTPPSLRTPMMPKPGERRMAGASPLPGVQVRCLNILCYCKPNLISFNNFDFFVHS